MQLPQTLRSVRRWTQTLLQNPYFWGGLGGLLLLGFTAYVLVDAVIMPSYTRHGVSVRVPDVEDRPFEKAKALVQRRDLAVMRQVGRFNPNVPQGTVVDQNPPASADVKPGRRVYLTVNSGTAPMVSIPDLNGISVREAKNRASSLGLQVDSVRPDSIPSPYPNTITRQKPEPGDSLKKGGAIDLWYSTGLGQDTVRVPNVAGRPVKGAQRLLLRHNLRFVVVNPRSSGSTTGPTSMTDTSSATTTDSSETKRFVRRQGRAPRTKVRAGTEIRLFTTTDSTEVPRPAPLSRDSPDVAPPTTQDSSRLLD